jgi:DNA-binding PadR family transcriptional regulator
MNAQEPAYWTWTISRALGRFLILREICARPAHGYALTARVARRTRGVFQPTQASIYPALAELERCGCIAVQTERSGHRSRHVYTATPAGRQACRLGREAWRKGFDAAMGGSRNGRRA